MGCRGESAAEARAGEQEVTFAFWIVVVVFVGVVGFFFLNRFIYILEHVEKFVLDE